MANRLIRKKSGKTTGETYREILSRVPYDGRWTEPLTLSDVTILGYRFPDDTHSHIYHFDLMNAHVHYLFFDCSSDGQAIVVFKNGEPSIQQARAIAAMLGGQEYKPNINCSVE